ncbi:MAG: peptide deformylase [Rhodospirillales bacterium]|nr:peptide deformylase [Rhodospirillales bacterium]
MAILKIARAGHPVLARQAKPVADPTDPAIAQLVADMVETMADAGGVGLAAPQVHASLRVIVFFVPPQRAADPEAAEGTSGGPVKLTCLINPQIDPLDPAIDEDWEACLSLPGLTGKVPRWRRIRYRALSLAGDEIDREAEGFHARVVQHEIDHLDGMLYFRRIRDLATFGFVEEVQRAKSHAQAQRAASEVSR